MEKYFFDYILGLLMKEIKMEEIDGKLNLILNKNTNLEIVFEDIENGLYSFTDNKFDVDKRAENLFLEGKIDENEFELLKEQHISFNAMLVGYGEIVNAANWHKVNLFVKKLNGQLYLPMGSAEYVYGDLVLTISYDPQQDSVFDKLFVENALKKKGLSELEVQYIRSDLKSIEKNWIKMMKELVDDNVKAIMSHHEDFIVRGEQGIYHVERDGTETTVVKNYRDNINIGDNLLNATAVDKIKKMQDIALLIIQE